MYNFYDKVLHKLGKEKGREVSFVNIGAMDGIMFDDSAGYVAMYEYCALYVEPIPYLFNRLKSNITDPRTKFENSAISDYDGIIQLLTIDKDAIDNKLVHDCFYGMSAVYPPKNGLASDGDREVVEKYGKLEIVPCITLNTLLTKHNITNIDILSIDAEGHDWTIVRQFDFTKYTPSVIRLEYINLTQEEKEKVCRFFSSNNYVFEISGQNIDAIPISLFMELFGTSENNSVQPIPKITIVTGLWDLGRGEISDDFKRSYDHYKNKFAELLKTPNNMIIHISKEDEDFIWEHRSKKNTVIKIMERNDFEAWFEFYTKVQEIRTREGWKEQAAWLFDSPQATLKHYNPVVMSKMFLLNDATFHNPFDSEYFFWIDAGITNTVHPGYFSHDKVFDNLPQYTDVVNRFIFLSYPYEGADEIHGFPRAAMARHCNTDYVRYVCRGGFFGGKKADINTINSLYHNMLAVTLHEGLMGTEESIFTILAHKFSELIYRFEIAGDGMIWPFFEKLKNVEEFIQSLPPAPVDIHTAKNNLYILTFNSPVQFDSVAKSIRTYDATLYDKSRKILINNSTDESLFAEYDRLCSEYGFEEIHRENLGVSGGRQFAAEHFDGTDADFYMFFEDDMHFAEEKDGVVCRNGFMRRIDNFYTKLLKIIIKEKFDFLKFSFSEFFGENNVQWAWYNVPQEVRTKYWPHYDKLPQHGLDPNAPRVEFKNIEISDGIPYVTGDIYYSNWPQIVTREGNKKMFLDTTWAYPNEQTWMSHLYQMGKEDILRSAVLLASPIEHTRFDFYEGNLRKES